MKKINLKSKFLLVDCTGVGFGGLTEFASRVLLSLANLNNLEIIVITDNLELVRKIQHPNIEVKFFNGHRIVNLMKSFMLIFCLRLTTKKFQFLSFSPSLPSLAMGKHKGVQFVNDLQFLTQSRGYKFLYKSFTLNLVTKNAKKIAVISSATGQKLQNYKDGLGQVRIIYLSGELDISRESTTDTLYDFVVIGHSTHKRGEKFLEICRASQLFESNIIFLKGERHVDESKYRDFKNLEFKGVLTSNEYARILASSRCLVMLSDPGTEGFGLPVAQALYLGRNTIISRDPALLEVSVGFSRVMNEEVSLRELDQNDLFNFEGVSDWPFANRTWATVAGEVVEYLNCDEPRRVS